MVSVVIAFRLTRSIVNAFSSELGHNLGLNHHSFKQNKYVMEPSVNLAHYDLSPGNADYIRRKVVNSRNCGWY